MNKILCGIVLVLGCTGIQAQAYDWAKPLDTQGSGGYAQDIKTDAIGNVYVTGYYYGQIDLDPGPATSAFTGMGTYLGKYSPAGNLIWAFGIEPDGGSASLVKAFCLALDEEENVVIAGRLTGTADFDPGPGITTIGTASINEFSFMAKYNNNGDLVWAKSLGSASRLTIKKVAVRKNHIVINGTYWGTNDFDPGAGITSLTSVGLEDIFMADYNDNGDLLWAKSFGTTTAGDDAFGLCLAPNKDIVVTGFVVAPMDLDPGPGIFMATSTSGNSYVACYDSTGVFKWAHEFTSANNNECYDVVTDLAGNVYVSGTFAADMDIEPGTGTTLLNAAAQGKGFFAKYDANGTLLWGQSLGTSGDNARLEINGSAVDAAGYYYITGKARGNIDFDAGPGTYIKDSVGFTDVFFAKYNPSGNIIWAESIGSPWYDEGEQIAADVNSIYITGLYGDSCDFDPGIDTTTLGTVGSNMFFAKYTNGGTIGVTETVNTPIHATIYPNPGNGNFNIVIEKPIATNVIVTNLSGTQVFNENYSVQNIYIELHAPTGLYLVHLITSEGSTVKKLAVQN